MSKVEPALVETLCAAVKIRGMAKFMTHEVLARDVLNSGFTSAHGPTEQWKEVCRNGQDGAVVLLFVKLAMVPLLKFSIQVYHEVIVSYVSKLLGSLSM